MKFKHIHPKKGSPVPGPWPLFLERRGFWKTVFIDTWERLLFRIEWAYLEFVYNSKDHEKISLALAGKEFACLFQNSIPDKDQSIFDRAVTALNGYSNVLAHGRLEWHGWRELPDSTQRSAFISWVPNERYEETSPLPIFRIFFPTMQIIERDVEAVKQPYEPHATIPLYKDVPKEFRTSEKLVRKTKICGSKRKYRHKATYFELPEEVALQMIIITIKRLLDFIQADERFKKLASEANL